MYAALSYHEFPFLWLCKQPAKWPNQNPSSRREVLDHMLKPVWSWGLHRGESHRIPERLRLEGTSGGPNTPDTYRDTYSKDTYSWFPRTKSRQILEISKGNHSLSRQPVPVLCHLNNREVLLDVCAHPQEVALYKGYSTQLLIFETNLMQFWWKGGGHLDPSLCFCWLGPHS